MFRDFGKSLGELVEGPVRTVGGIVTLDDKEAKKGVKKTVSGVVGTVTLGMVRDDNNDEHNDKKDACHNRPRKP